ncbi:MAG: hypothetical protein ACHQIM_09110 [Sphingobacteriales bacterium]
MKISCSIVLIFLMGVASSFSCKKTNNPSPQLTVGATSVNFTADGRSQDVTITCNADWSLNFKVNRRNFNGELFDRMIKGREIDRC